MNKDTIQEKYSKLMDEMYRSFHFFNKHFCEGKLNEPVITLQGDKRKSTYGWFGKEFWTEYVETKNGKGEVKKKLVKINELNLTAETLYRSPNEVLETLLHEMAHLKNAQNNIPDCTKTQYHNKEFKKAAEFFGLTVSRMKGKGWATTALNTKAKDAIELLKPNKELYNIARTPPLVLKKDPTTITLNIDISYEDKIAVLEGIYGKKRKLAEEAIDMLYKHNTKPKVKKVTKDLVEVE